MYPIRANKNTCTYLSFDLGLKPKSHSGLAHRCRVARCLLGGLITTLGDNHKRTTYWHARGIIDIFGLLTYIVSAKRWHGIRHSDPGEHTWHVALYVAHLMPPGIPRRCRLTFPFPEQMSNADRPISPVDPCSAPSTGAVRLSSELWGELSWRPGPSVGNTWLASWRSQLLLQSCRCQFDRSGCEDPWHQCRHDRG